MGEEHTVRLRDAGETDVAALAALHVRTFRETHGGGPDVALRERQWRAKLASGQLIFCIVLESSSSELVGFASGERHGADELRRFGGELSKIYLLRAAQGRGLGRRLLCGAAERFVAAGIGSMLLFGDARSRSNGFYERMGAERLYASNGDFHGGYRWPELTTLLAHCAGRLPATAL